MRPVPLSVLKGGIQRLRTKGGAATTSLYELLNAYVTEAGTVVPREGTIRVASLDATSKGLAAMDGVLELFATSLIEVPAGFHVNVLLHPTDVTQEIERIWFAQPFMGFLYVVAQFTNSDVFHYWLQSDGPWTADTVYDTGDIIEPTVSNGLAYRAVRDLQAYPTWSPQTAVTEGTIIEPSVPTGYVYQAVAVEGASPHTGDAEPTWPVTEGGQVQEFGDFNTSTTPSDMTSASGAQPIGSALTDRYGNSLEIAGQVGTTPTSSSSAITAATSVSTWQPGTLYQPGAVVQPSTGQGAFIGAIPNGDFEAGDDGNWILPAGSNISYSNAGQYQGDWCLKCTPNRQTSRATMLNYGTVTPGQSVTATAYVNPNNTGTDLTLSLNLHWYASDDTPLGSTAGAGQRGIGYRQASVTGNAPAGAARCRVEIEFDTGTVPAAAFADLVSWNLEQPAAVSPFLFEAIQTSAGTSGSAEPAWPTVAGNTVTDGEVTWQAIGTSIITWQALPILKSGDTEPVWPIAPGLSVPDGNMSWECVNRQITDPKNPNTIAVALGASHVFAVDKDIVAYSAAVNPTDWSTVNNAGYLPTGLNNYGQNPAAVLGLYRSNLVVFNASGYQMWQIDPDPQNMALLDAQPVGSTYPLAVQAIADDLVFLTLVGVRNMATSGPTANMQTGATGQAVDPIVKARLKAGTYDPISLYYPGRGQYWLIFGPEAIVLTINGAAQKSWSRYVFPDAITDWCLNGGVLYLRTAGNLVLRLDEDTLVDDSGGAEVGFIGRLQWPFIDLGALGITKELLGIDLVGTGDVSIQIAWDQRDTTAFSDDPGFATCTTVTPPYELAAADTVPGQPIPIPVSAPSFSPVLTFAAGQKWEFEAANLYLNDAAGAGAVG